MTEIILPDLPKGAEYEEYVSALYQVSGYYIERNIIDYTQNEAILELDIIATKYRDRPVLALLEAKSGTWGFPDIFKLRGWMDYLRLERGIFVAQNERDKLDLAKKIALDLEINLIVVPDPDKVSEDLLKLIGVEEIDACDVNVWRYSYWVERNLLKELKTRENNRHEKRYVAMNKSHYEINSGVFFAETVAEKIDQIYTSFKTCPRMSAKCGHEMCGEEFDLEYEDVPHDIFKNTYYNCYFNDIQIATYIEQKTRLAVLKNAIDYKLFSDIGESGKVDRIVEVLGMEFSHTRFLPDTFKEGLIELSKHEYFRFYPIFWQWFLWVFGGFILKDYEEQEHKLLSKKTGIPIENIPEALNAFDILFPQEGGWFRDLNPPSNISILKMHSVPFMGIGAHYRKIMYSDTNKYDDLALSGIHTSTDLKKWNNMSVRVLQL